MAEATNENVNLLLTKIMTDRFCKVEANDFDACIANYVPQRIDNSFVDVSLQRKGLKKCEPYKEAAQRCLQDQKHQQAILRTAAKAPVCKQERSALAQCQKASGSDPNACEQQAIDMLMCGLAYIVQRSKGSKDKNATQQQFDE